MINYRNFNTHTATHTWLCRDVDPFPITRRRLSFRWILSDIMKYIVPDVYEIDCFVAALHMFRLWDGLCRRHSTLRYLILQESAIWSTILKQVIVGHQQNPVNHAWIILVVSGCLLQALGVGSRWYWILYLELELELQLMMALKMQLELGQELIQIMSSLLRFSEQHNPFF